MGERFETELPVPHKIKSLCHQLEYASIQLEAVEPTRNHEVTLDSQESFLGNPQEPQRWWEWQSLVN